jgi:hypothetical protein
MIKSDLSNFFSMSVFKIFLKFSMDFEASPFFKIVLKTLVFSLQIAEI